MVPVFWETIGHCSYAYQGGGQDLGWRGDPLSFIMGLEHSLKCTYLSSRHSDLALVAGSSSVPQPQSASIIQPLDLREQGSVARLDKRRGVND